MRTRTDGSRLSALGAFALGAALGTIALTAVPVESREPSEFAAPDAQAFPPNTIVARYPIDAAALSDVTNPVELVAALREHLRVEVAMPSDEPLAVHMSGQVTDPVSGGAYPFLYGGLGFDHESYTPASGDLASIVRASREPQSVFDDEWDEDEAWKWLLETVETGLTTSLAANGRFQRGGDGHVGVEVAAVHAASAHDSDPEEKLEHMYLKLHPSVRFQSSMMADWEPPEGLAYDVKDLLIELDPGALPPLATAEVSTDALDRLPGVYRVEGGADFTVRRGGDGHIGVVSEEGEQLEFRLHPRSETEFVAEIDGRRMELAFELGDDDRATSLTVGQAGFSTTLPRIP